MSQSPFINRILRTCLCSSSLCSFFANLIRRLWNTKYFSSDDVLGEFKKSFNGFLGLIKSMYKTLLVMPGCWYNLLMKAVMTSLSPLIRIWFRRLEPCRSVCNSKLRFSSGLSTPDRASSINLKSPSKL